MWRVDDRAAYLRDEAMMLTGGLALPTYAVVHRTGYSEQLSQDRHCLRFG